MLHPKPQPTVVNQKNMLRPWVLLNSMYPVESERYPCVPECLTRVVLEVDGLGESGEVRDLKVRWGGARSLQSETRGTLSSQTHKGLDAETGEQEGDTDSEEHPE
jgi:hypothetical protein